MLNHGEIFNTIRLIYENVIFAIALLVLALLAPSAQAHVPLMPQGNEKISAATHIDDPQKSWAIYANLKEGEAQYYSIKMNKGERIYISLLISTDPKDRGFDPSIVLMGPGLKANGSLPEFVSVPAGYDALNIGGLRSNEASYEPFGPSSYYQSAELNISASISGKYYVAVYDTAKSGGKYCLAIGYREEFSLMERIISPVQIISVYQWEGQNIGFIMAPIIAAGALGLMIIWRRIKPTPFGSAGTMAGMLFIGSSATVLSQIAFNLTRASPGQEVMISLILAVIPALFGVMALRISFGEAGLLQRMALAIIGTLALISGVGLVIGPALAMAASVLPSGRSRSTSAAFNAFT